MINFSSKAESFYQEQQQKNSYPLQTHGQASNIESKQRERIIVGWGNFSPQTLKGFEGYSQKSLKPFCYSNLKILALNLKNIALILTSNFEKF